MKTIATQSYLFIQIMGFILKSEGNCPVTDTMYCKMGTLRQEPNNYLSPIPGWHFDCLTVSRNTQVQMYVPKNPTQGDLGTCTNLRIHFANDMMLLDTSVTAVNDAIDIPIKDMNAQMCWGQYLESASFGGIVGKTVEFLRSNWKMMDWP
ncbi:hypothetical protein ABG067_008004 [Albugo candida]